MPVQNQARRRWSSTQATTSGSSISFSPPGWAKTLRLVLRGVGTNGTSPLCARMNSESSGYLGTVQYAQNVVAAEKYTGEFRLTHSTESQAASISHGEAFFARESGNGWVMRSHVGRSDKAQETFSAGSKALSAELSSFELTTVAGAAAFNAGSVTLVAED